MIINLNNSFFLDVFRILAVNTHLVLLTYLKIVFLKIIIHMVGSIFDHG